MAQPSNYTSSSAYASSSAYTETSDNQTGGDATGRKDTPDQNLSASGDASKSQSMVTTKSGVKIPLLKIKAPPQEGGLSALPVPVASDQTPASPERGAPGPAPLILPGMPGLPLRQATSPRSGMKPPAVPQSPVSAAPDSAYLQPASPRKKLAAPPTPRRLPTRGDLDSSPGKATGSLSPRAQPVIPTNITTASVTADITTAQSNPMPSASVPASPADSPLLSPDGHVQIMRIRTRVSSRLLGEEPLSPRTPRSADWTRVAPTTSTRSLAVTTNPHVPRAQLVAEAVKFYSSATLELLTEGKPESIKSLGRKDPEIAAKDMPDSLKSLYQYKAAKSFPVAPLLRQLFKATLEAAPQWKKAEKFISQAISQCNPEISFGDGDKTVKEKEIARFKPLAEAAIDALFPVTKTTGETKDDGQIRKLSDSLLTRDFIVQVLLAVDSDVIERCKKDPQLSIDDINKIRYNVAFDLIFTRILLPMIARRFPAIPNQSQAWLQSALAECLKNAMPEIARDFFERSMKTMSEQHRSFFEKKAKQEEEEAVKKGEKIREQRIAALKEKSVSSRNMNYYNAIADQKKRREYTKKNSAIFDQLVSALNAEQLDSKLANLLEKEISRKLKDYDGLKTLDHIRNDLLSMMKKLPENDVSQPVRAFIIKLAKEVDADTAKRIKGRTVAFDPRLLQDLVELSDMLTPSVGDQTFIDYAMIETFHDEPSSGSDTSSGAPDVPVLTTTTGATATTTTTTTTTMITTATTTATTAATAIPVVIMTNANSNSVTPNADTRQNL